ncbi:hypothetical protein VMCG_03899 [Cytospora schulzeri]|uniref:Ketoreductase (KR) domain-containing protein n=1 Tax=Cytospora schulzeri TaxID=448051 RepID=A0A423WVG0_9PEZI|nr:hypothetical protein VMCG_03899 [Valsa malicola]
MLDANSVFRVDGIVAVVTGGGTGIGWNMAEALAVNGARKVYILGRRLDVLKQGAAKYPDVMVPLVCDVTSKESLQSAVDQVSKDIGYINLLIANSGIAGPANHYNPSLPLPDLRSQLLSASMEDFTKTLHVNVTGAWFTMASFLELLDAGNKHAVSGEAGAFGAPVKEGVKVPSIQSQVVFISSLAAFSRGHWTAPSYGGSKAAIMQLMKHASTNLVRHGIRANALAPGLFPSELTTELLSGRKPEEETPDDHRWIPVQKFGGEEEMAGAILYLASRAGSFTNGMVLLNDGGRASIIPATY